MTGSSFFIRVLLTVQVRRRSASASSLARRELEGWE
jgi:hypothetical protein